MAMTQQQLEDILAAKKRVRDAFKRWRTELSSPQMQDDLAVLFAAKKVDMDGVVVTTAVADNLATQFTAMKALRDALVAFDNAVV